MDPPNDRAWEKYHPTSFKMRLNRKSREGDKKIAYKGSGLPVSFFVGRETKQFRVKHQSLYSSH